VPASPEDATTGLVDALGLDRAPELVSVVGGGGKSSLLFALAECLPGRVVLTTTTRIFAAQMSGAAAVCTTADEDWQDELDRFDSHLLVVGRVEGERAVGVPPDLPAEWLARPHVDWVVVEADGSRMLPVKAPADHEPVVAERTSLLVSVVGIDALAAPIERVAHRPERVADITGLAPSQHLTPEAIGSLLASPRGGLKGAPEGARVAVLINKVESSTQRHAAHRIADRVLDEARIERVAIGALHGDPGAGWEVRSR
jgi:molybdenum cofactor cytidylyltransferase